MIIILRLLGVLIIIFGVIWRAYLYSVSSFRAEGYWFTYLGELLTGLSAAMLCFAGALALGRLNRIEMKNDQQREYLRRLVASREARVSKAPTVPPKTMPEDHQQSPKRIHPNQRYNMTAAEKKDAAILGRDARIRKQQRINELQAEIDALENNEPLPYTSREPLPISASRR